LSSDEYSGVVDKILKLYNSGAIDLSGVENGADAINVLLTLYDSLNGGNLESFIALIRGFFDQKGSHVQFNVVSRETLLDAQQHPEKYKSLVVRVAGYSALFTTLSKPLQDDIINRTEQASF